MEPEKPPRAFRKYRLKNQMWLHKPKIISDVENGRACAAVDEFVSLLYSEDAKIDVSFNLEEFAFINYYIFKRLIFLYCFLFSFNLSIILIHSVQ